MVVKVVPSAESEIVVTVPPDTMTLMGTFSGFVKVKGEAPTETVTAGP